MLINDWDQLATVDVNALSETVLYDIQSDRKREGNVKLKDRLTSWIILTDNNSIYSICTVLFSV